MKTRLVLASVLAMSCLGVLGDRVAAYNVCSDDGAPCTHEDMASFGLDLLPDGFEAKSFEDNIRAGAGDEDVFDHIYGYPNHLILAEAIITMTHFWDADAGDNTPSTYGAFEDPVFGIDVALIVTENALQKARLTWSLALGAYARGDKAKAYEYLGHIAHFLGDMSVPTHAHGDAHVDFFGDSDPFEEWMSEQAGEDPTLTPAELDALKVLDADTLNCYLRIAAYMSRVFDEQTFAQAYAVLDTPPGATSQMTALFDVQLLAAWLNFANGAIEWNRLVDTNRDRTPDTPFLAAMEAAESLRLNPATTSAQLDAMKRIVESWTNLP